MSAGFFDPLVCELYELSYQFEHPYLVNHHKYAARFGNHSANPLAVVRETVNWFKTEKGLA